MKKLLVAGVVGAALAFALDPTAAMNLITPQRLMAHIKVLASDEYEGRAPSTRGEVLSVKYLDRSVQELGSETGKSGRNLCAGRAAFGILSTPQSHVTAGGKTIELEPKKDIRSLDHSARPGSRRAGF